MKLVKLFLLAIVISALSTTASAQRYGIRAGANIASLTGGNDNSISPRTSFYFGVFKEMGIVKDLFYIQPELQYSSQGFSSDFTGTDEDYSIDYLTIPVLAKVYVAKIFSFEAGPQFGFKVADNFEGAASDSIESFDAAGVVGLNINLPLRISINARYVFGFSEVITDSDLKTSVVQAGLSYRF
ncbi:porin family protein [Flavobacterium sp. RSB2_4_14]|uniref:porin family protein n=1 Tax=Flavobacterium sp. RSB2_4_14 TaxID=3447665 RepID=UPI003F37F2A5